MIAELFKVLAAGLSIWESKEKRKYVDKLMELKRDWYEEFNKGPGKRNNAVLDNIKLELRILAAAFATSVGAADAGNPSG